MARILQREMSVMAAWCLVGLYCSRDGILSLSHTFASGTDSGFAGGRSPLGRPCLPPSPVAPASSHASYSRCANTTPTGIPPAAVRAQPCTRGPSVAGHASSLSNRIRMPPLPCSRIAAALTSFSTSRSFLEVSSRAEQHARTHGKAGLQQFRTTPDQIRHRFHLTLTLHNARDVYYLAASGPSERASPVSGTP